MWETRMTIISGWADGVHLKFAICEEIHFKLRFPFVWNTKVTVSISDKLNTPPKNGSPVNHRTPSSTLSTVLHSIPSGRKQKKIPAALKEVCVT